MDNTASLRERYSNRLLERGIDRHRAAKEIGCNQDSLRKWMRGKESNFVDSLVSRWLDAPAITPEAAAPAPIILEAPTAPITRESSALEPGEAMDRLNEQNRILQGCTMLPRGKKLTDEQIQTVREAFLRFTDEFHIKDAQVAREIDYAPAVVSQWKDGKYKGRADKVAHAINDWIERSKRRSHAERPKDYVSTWVAESMRTLAYQAHIHSMMAAIVAPAGCGKTKVLKAMTEEFRAVYVYCSPNITERELLYKIALALGFKKEIGSKIAMTEFVIGQLAGTKRTIFLDEAQQLKRSIGVVRAIYDQTDCPIVMAGTAEILNYVDDRADGRGQFSSRCMCCNIIESVRNVESPDGGKAGRDLFTIEEIQQFFKSKQMKLSGDALRLMLALACLPNHGALRLIEKLAAIAAGINPEVERLEREHIIEALDLHRGAAFANHMENLASRHDRQSALLNVG